MTKKSPDLSEFFKLSQPKKPPCRIGLILAGEIDPPLGAEGCEQLRAALATDQGLITNIAIATWLETRGHEVHCQRVLAHRKGTCSCGKA